MRVADGYSIVCVAGLYLTADAGELVFEADFMFIPQASTYWVDIAGGGATTPLAEYGVVDQKLIGWAANNRHALWTTSLNYIEGMENVFVLDIRDHAVLQNQVDLEFAPRNAYFSQGGEWIVLRSRDDGTIWVAPVVDGVPGQPTPWIGEQAGEDPVEMIAPDRSGAYITVNYDNGDDDCEIIRLLDGSTDWLWDIGPCTSAGAPLIRDQWAYFFVKDLSSVRTIWRLDLQDPNALPEPVSGPQAGWPTAISPAGSWVVYRTGAGQTSRFWLAGVSQPGVNTQLVFDGMEANYPPRILP